MGGQAEAVIEPDSVEVNPCMKKVCNELMICLSDQVRSEPDTLMGADDCIRCRSEG